LKPDDAGNIFQLEIGLPQKLQVKQLHEKQIVGQYFGNEAGILLDF